MVNVIVEKFDPTIREHVLWLKYMDYVMEDITNENERRDLSKEINENPMNIKHKNIIDWPFIHFQLVMKYTKSVFRGKAYIPEIDECK